MFKLQEDSVKFIASLFNKTEDQIRGNCHVISMSLNDDGTIGKDDDAEEVYVGKIQGALGFDTSNDDTLDLTLNGAACPSYKSLTNAGYTGPVQIPIDDEVIFTKAVTGNTGGEINLSFIGYIIRLTH